MFPCPSCGRPVPEVLGAPEQVCPHCRNVVGPRRLRTGPLLAEGFAALLRRAPTWWRLFLLPALVVDAATAAVALSVPGMAGFLTGCGAVPAAPSLLFFAAAFLLLFVQLGAYFVGWALVAAEAAGRRRDGDWWRNTLRGSALLAVLFTVALGLLVLPALLLFVWFLLAPVALGRGATPSRALDAARDANARRPTGLVLFALAFTLAAETALLAAACAGSFWVSLAAQGLVWWLLAPVVPVLTAQAFARVSERAA